MRADSTITSVDIAGQDAAVLSVAEIGLGSIIHAFHIPLGGQVLSLNQGFILSRSVLKSRGFASSRTIGFTVSSIAAILKSLSPAGKKLTPMLAISAQGLFFTMGTLIFGANLVGIIVGSVLAGFWAFIQPLLIYYLLYGNTAIDVADFYFKKFGLTAQHLVLPLVMLMSLKAVLSIGLAACAYFLPEIRIQTYQDALLRVGKSKTQSSIVAQGTETRGAFRMALRDLFNPIFGISLLLTTIFFVFAEAPFSDLFWALLRPLAVGFLIFFIIRRISFNWLFVRIQRSPFKSFGKSLRIAIQALKEV